MDVLHKFATNFTRTKLCFLLQFEVAQNELSIVKWTHKSIHTLRFQMPKCVEHGMEKNLFHNLTF